MTVHVDISGLIYGDYFSSLVVSSAEAINSPDTAQVHLELVGNMTYLEVRPDSLTFVGYIGEKGEQLEIPARQVPSSEVSTKLTPKLQPSVQVWRLLWVLYY